MSAEQPPENKSDQKTDALDALEREFRKFWTTLEDGGVKDAKARVEARLRTSPWLVLGAIGFVGLLLGFILGGRRRK